VMVALVEPPEPGAMVNAEATPAPDKVTVPPRPGALQTQADFQVRHRIKQADPGMIVSMISP